MEAHPEGAGVEEKNANTTGQNTTVSELKDEESEKIRRILAQVKSVLRKSEAKARRRGGKKPQTLIFCHRHQEKKNVNKPKEDEENLEDPPSTSDSPGLPRAEDNSASTPSPDQELE